MNFIYLYYFVICFLMILLAYFYGYRTKKWKWSEYCVMTFGPLAGLAFLVWLDGLKMISLFVVFCFIGFGMEFILGFFAEKILGQKIWVYKKLSVLGHTSPLTIPFWGAVGLAFWSLGKLFGF